MGDMFWEAERFNGDLSAWNVAKVTDMSSMLDGAEAFNIDHLASWKVPVTTKTTGVFGERTRYKFITITMPISGESFNIKTAIQGSTIAELKDNIAAVNLAFPAEQQKLMLSNKTLADNSHVPIQCMHNQVSMGLVMTASAG